MHSLKTFVKHLVFRPRGLGSIGTNSWFHRPWTISGAQNISVGANCFIRGHSWLAILDTPQNHHSASPTLTIGDGVYIGRYSYFTVASQMSIGSGCVLSEHVYVADSTHGYDPLGGPILDQPLNVRSPVIIGEMCFIGYRAVIMPGVTLGKNCVVAANSVVTKSFPAYSMVGGVPARLLKVYSTESATWESVPRSRRDEN